MFTNLSTFMVEFTVKIGFVHPLYTRKRFTITLSLFISLYLALLAIKFRMFVIEVFLFFKFLYFRIR